MRIVNVSYVYFKNHADPEKWIKESGFFKKIWEALALVHKVFFFEFINYNGTFKENGVDYRFSTANRIALLFPLVVNFRIRSVRPDVVLVNGLHSPVQVILLRAVLGKNVHIILQNHGEQPFRNLIKKHLQQYADQCINAYFFTSKAQAKNWIDESIISDTEKVFEIMEVVSVFEPMERFAARQKTNVSGEHTYLWVGHLNENKNPLLLVRAMLSFLRKEKRCALYMIFQSQALLDEISNLLNEHIDVSAGIHLVGKVLHEDLVYWYSSVDFIVSTSFQEAGGVSVCEAMSCGCIPLLSEIPSFRNMIHNKSGILFEAGNQASLENALQESCLMDKKKERDLTLENYANRLSSKAIASAIEKVLYSL